MVVCAYMDAMSDAIMEELDSLRANGELRNYLPTCAVRYQASQTHAGFLEQISEDGSRKIGLFIDGEFQPIA